ncbi:hypothetical protein [Streptomyces sp. NPDC059411]|uniref:hypothetical protein n=1 Tax=Streptomyces sp. NPDC059411 TaxID=3346825 RepID=UPI0036B9BE00
MTEHQTIGELVYGHIGPGESGYANRDADLSLIGLTTPILPFKIPDFDSFIAEARETIKEGEPPEFARYPLPEIALDVQQSLRLHVERYIEPEQPRADRLYVLEFQGARQYTMFGHSTNLTKRVQRHCQDATPHGYALLNAWASPGVASAGDMERVALDWGDTLHHHMHYRERYYDMPFEKGLTIVRAVFEEEMRRAREGTAQPDASVPVLS